MFKRRDITVTGSGVIGALAAAYLGRMLPAHLYKITYFKALNGLDGHESLYSTLHADTRQLNRLLKINEAQFISHCDGVFSLGEKTINDAADYLNTYAPYGLTVEGLNFTVAMQKVGYTGSLQDWEDYNLPARMIRQGKFLPPDTKGRAIISDYTYGYQINPNRYMELLLSQAEKFGVTVIEAQQLELKISKNGSTSIKTQDGKVFTPFLVINCVNHRMSKFLKIRASAIGDLFFTKQSVTQPGYKNHIQHEMTDQAIKTAITCQSETHELTFTQDKPSDVSLKLGNHLSAWSGNTVHLGQTYGLLPVLGAPFRINQIALERLINLFPTDETMTAEREEYNTIMNRVYDRFDDFQSIWLGTSTLSFKHSVTLSEDAHYKIRLFEARGRIAMLDDDDLFQDHWISLFLGQNIWPKGGNLMSKNISDETIEKFLLEFNQIVKQTESKMPFTTDFIKRNCPTNLSQKVTSHAG